MCRGAVVQAVFLSDSAQGWCLDGATTIKTLLLESNISTSVWIQMSAAPSPDELAGYIDLIKTTGRSRSPFFTFSRHTC